METTSSHTEDRGAGGKLRRAPARKTPAKPYSRPPPATAPAEQRRWLSKLVVDPACRIITGGASLLFPSFFSKSPTISDAEAGDDAGEDHSEESETVFDPRAANGDDQNRTINHEVIKTNGLEGPSKEDHVSERNSDLVGQKKEVKSDDDNGLSDIEQLLMGKNLSRDEVNRLVGIMNSRAIESPNKEQEKNKDQSIGARADSKELVASHEIIDLTSDRKPSDLSGSSWQPSTPLPQSVMLDEVCASPVDIAKAYMGSRTIETGSYSKGSIRNNDKSILYSSDFATNPYIPSPSPKPSAHWPGSMVQDKRDYFTPQTHRGRSGLHNFPRTPYSRTIFSKAKSNMNQVQGDNDKWAKSPASVQKLPTPIFGQEKSKGGVAEDNYGSIGPIRRSRHKIGAQAPFNGSVFSSSSVGPSRVEKSKFSQVLERNFESGVTSSGFKSQSVDRKNRSLEAGSPTVHPHSSQIARSILEHIDRNPPTPKEKLEELKLACAWKNPDSSKSSRDPNGQKSLLNLKGSDSQKIVNPSKSNSLLFAPSQENTFSAVNTRNNPSRSDLFLNNGTDRNQTKSSHEVLNPQKKPPIPGTKPVLSSISIDKPIQKWKFSADQSSGFTFPVSTASGVLSEPPTPSIMPSFSSNDQNQPTEKTEVPAYTFGSKNSESALVFSFPSTSSAGGETDSSDINFTFGSDQPRLSFGSVGKNTICY